MTEGLLARVRRVAGLSQGELARRAGTSRPTVSAYEHGRKSPSLDTLERLLDAAGYQLYARPRIAFCRGCWSAGTCGVAGGSFASLAD